MRARLFAAPVVLLAALAVAGCAAPDPEIVVAEAQSVFDELVAHASATDAAVLRTLETAEPTRQECAGDEPRTQTARTATGVLSITADADAAVRIRDELADTLDPERWAKIAAATPEQRAWISENDVVVTLSADGSALVIAVFTPCSDAPDPAAFASPVGMPYTG